MNSYLVNIAGLMLMAAVIWWFWLAGKHEQPNRRSRSARRLARTLHKWIGLFIGLQVFIWLATGLYMVIVDLDFIHGDPLVRNMEQPVTVPTASRVSVATLLSQYPDARHIGLQAVGGKTYYTLATAQNRYLIDPVNGKMSSPLTENTVREIAQYHFNGDASIRAASLLTTNPPQEIGRRPLPLWRVDFDDRFNTSFYIDPVYGNLVTRRHQYWRIFDFFWMLHIMDYRQRTNAHNLLVISAELFSVIFTLTGLWLLFYSFKRRTKAGPQAN